MDQSSNGRQQEGHFPVSLPEQSSRERDDVAAGCSTVFTPPESFGNRSLDDHIVSRRYPHGYQARRHSTSSSTGKGKEHHSLRHAPHRRASYSVPDSWANLSEVAPVLPVENVDDLPIYRHRTLEEARSAERLYEKHTSKEHKRTSFSTTHGDAQLSLAVPQNKERDCMSSKCVIL